MEMNNILLNIKTINADTLNILLEQSKRILYNLSTKKGYNLNIVDLDGIISTAIAEYNNRYTNAYKTAPSTFYYIILVRTFNHEYVKASKTLFNEKLYHLNDYTHIKDIEESLVHYDEIMDLESDIRALKTINDNTKDILIMALHGISNSDIAREKGLTRQRISQIFKNLSKNYEIISLLKGK